jgi:tRNA1(Val) A37 N6-methylase TrmN6
MSVSVIWIVHDDDENSKPTSVLSSVAQNREQCVVCCLQLIIHNADEQFDNMFIQIYNNTHVVAYLLVNNIANEAVIDTKQ